MFPSFLEKFCLSEEHLIELIENPEISWQIPSSSTCSPKNFYYELHNYVKKSPKIKMFSKTSIGKLYTKIDPYLRERKFRPDNAYRYIDRLVHPSSVPNLIHCQSKEPQYSSFNDDVTVETSVLDSLEPPHFNDEHPMIHVTDAKCRPTKVNAACLMKNISYLPRNVVRREHRSKGTNQIFKRMHTTAK